MSTSISSQQVEDPIVDPEFRQRSADIFDQWQQGDVNYVDTVSALRTMLQEAEYDINQVHQGRIENLLGILHGIRADYRQSITHFERARSLYEHAGALQYVATSDLNIGETYRLRGNFTRARMYFHRAYERAKELEVVDIQATAIANEGQMWLSLNSLNKAQQVLQEALRLSDMAWGDPESKSKYHSRLEVICETHHVLVEIALIEGDIQRAWEHAQKSYEIGQTLNHPLRVGQSSRAIADVLTVMGCSPDASFENDPDHYYGVSLAAFRDIKSESEVAKTIFHQGKSLAHRGKKRRAAKLYQQAMVLFTRLGMTDDAAKAAESQLDII